MKKLYFVFQYHYGYLIYSFFYNTMLEINMFIRRSIRDKSGEIVVIRC